MAQAETLELGALYRAHAQTVARWAARLGGPGIDVEDVVQEVFLVAHRHLAGFRGEAKVTTWLFRITRNVVRHRLRKERLRRLFAPFSGGGEEAVEVPSQVRGPAENLEQQEAQTLVYRVLDGMNEKYRTAFVLFELDGCSGEEVAQYLGTKVSNVWVLLHRARAQFQVGLDKLTREDRS